VLAIDVGRFRKFEEFGRDVEELVGVLKTLPRAEGFDQILMPGEILFADRRGVVAIAVTDKRTSLVLEMRNHYLCEQRHRLFRIALSDHTKIHLQ
jgi:LDH2 family malate/lactate/ureidoglycolate dehydrogenase